VGVTRSARAAAKLFFSFVFSCRNGGFQLFYTHMDRAALHEIASGTGRRCLRRLFEPLRHAPSVKMEFLGPFDVNGEACTLPHCTISTSQSADAIRLGLFGAIHGDEPAGALGLIEFLLELSAQPEWGAGYEVHAYPVCNPTGFVDNTRMSRRGRDLNREFWRQSPEPEVQILEKELALRRFDGIIQLHADDTSEGIYGFVRGHTLTENLLRPALAEAGKILPRNVNPAIDGFAARDGIIYKHYEGVLAAPVEIEPVPFEIIFETPHAAPIELQVQALLAALRAIMTEYRLLLSFAQNI
jgi:murein peptide amidase A